MSMQTLSLCQVVLENISIFWEYFIGQYIVLWIFLDIEILYFIINRIYLLYVRMLKMNRSITVLM